MKTKCNPSKRISIHNVKGYIDITVPPPAAAEFRHMVQRAINTWQDMSPEMRDFADRLLGKDALNTTSEFRTASDPERIRSCCHTMLKEPHHTQCPEKDKVASYVKPLCTGHPETCNCPKHCR